MHHLYASSKRIYRLYYSYERTLDSEAGELARREIEFYSTTAAVVCHEDMQSTNIFN